MSNVHGFGSNRGQGRMPAAHHDDYESMPFLGSSNISVNPRKETVWDMMRFNCCPTFSIFTFIAFITAVDIVMYIITLVWAGIETPSLEFLKPKYSTLELFGNRVPYLMRYDYQVWRFVTPVFLHANFLHIVFNVMSQLVVGSFVENWVGSKKIIVIYFASAIGGNLFGALVSSAAAVGASTAIVGLLGVFIAMIILYWYRFDPMTKCLLVCIAGFIIFFNLLYGMGSSSQQTSQVDNYGHLGGLITGIFSGMALAPTAGNPGRYEKRVKTVGYVLWAIYFVLGFTLFYTVVYPTLP